MKCIDCKHKSEEGYVNTKCLSCKHAYLPNHEAYERKSDLYEKFEVTRDEI